MGNKNKNKKKPQTGGLQPKGGAYANQDAKLAAEGDISAVVDSPAAAKAMLKEKKRTEKVKAEKEKEKSKQKKTEKKEKKGIIKALRETGTELKKVRWPGLNRTLKQTGVVLGVVVVFGLVIFGLDRLMAVLYDLLTKGYN